MNPKKKQHLGLGIALLLIAGTILVIEQPWRPRSRVPPPPADLPAGLLQFPGAPDFGGATGWLNSEPLDLVALRGSVVLVDFWTYSCINCIRTLPHLEGWHERYEDDGLVVVGVHSPEFGFERDPGNVEAAVERYGLTYPVALDNDFSIWDAYANRFWPTEYLVDRYGRIRHVHIGEGGYAETEERIRELIRETGTSLSDERVENETVAEIGGDLSPELYAAAAQGLDRVRIGNQEGYEPGETIAYGRPESVERDLIYLVGTWRNNQEDVTALNEGASVIVRFRAAQANFVASGATGACAEVHLDGENVPPHLAGRDVGTNGTAPCILLDGPRSYDFYDGPFEEHTIEIEAPAGFSLYTFAFSRTGRP